jgi:hypothetical protein
MPGDDEEAGRREIASNLGAQPVLVLGRSGLEVAEFEDGKSGHSVGNLSPYGAHFFSVVASAGSPEAL